MARRKLALHWQIAIAMLLAVVVGSIASEHTAIGSVHLIDACTFVGALFLRALKMLVVPLILASIIVGIASVGETKALGRLAGKTALYYVTTSLIAVLVGLALVDSIRPGLVDGEPAKDRIGLSGDTDDVAQQVEGRSSRDVVDVFLRMVPENVVDDAAKGNMLGLIFFALVFGAFMTQLPEPHRTGQVQFWQGVYEIMLRVTDWVMKFAPIGVFALVTKVVLATGLGALRPLLWFLVTVLCGLVLHAFVVLPSLLATIGRVHPLRHFSAMAPALLMAFSTASSSATLPLTVDRLENHAGVSRRVTSFVIPLGATVNMDGTALYECVTAMFIAQAYGIHLSFAQQFTVVAIALVTSIGVAGIPAASLVAITLILTSIGLPVEAIGLVLAVDRVLDMCRTAVNVLSDSCGAVIVARSEGETAILTSTASG